MAAAEFPTVMLTSVQFYVMMSRTLSCKTLEYIDACSSLLVPCCAVQVTYPELTPPHVSTQETPLTVVVSETPPEMLGSSMSAPTDTPEPSTAAAEATGPPLDQSVAADAPAGALEDSAPLTEEQEDQELQWAILSSLHQGPWASTPALQPAQAAQDATNNEQESAPQPPAANPDRAEENTRGRSAPAGARDSAQRAAGSLPLAAVAAGVAVAATHAVAATADAVHRCHHHQRRNHAEAAERRQRQWEHTAAHTACELQRQQWRDVAAEARRHRMLQRQCNAAARRHLRQSVLSDTILGSIAAAFLTPLVHPCTLRHHTMELHVEPVQVGTGSRFSCKGRRRCHGQYY